MESGFQRWSCPVVTSPEMSPVTSLWSSQLFLVPSHAVCMTIEYGGNDGTSLLRLGLGYVASLSLSLCPPLSSSMLEAKMSQDIQAAHVKESRSLAERLRNRGLQ